MVKTSAIKGEGIQELLEILDYQAQLLELKADFGGPARGTVIEARPMEGRGAVANVLVQDGELKLGDFIVAGRAFGRVRDITDDRGQRLKVAPIISHNRTSTPAVAGPKVQAATLGPRLTSQPVKPVSKKSQGGK